MGRRTSGQQVGFQAIGNVQANQATLTTTQSNADLTLDPSGTGIVVINTDVTIADQSDLRLREASANGTNYIAQQAAANMAANYTITWPAAVAGASAVLFKRLLSEFASTAFASGACASFAAASSDNIFVSGVTPLKLALF